MDANGLLLTTLGGADIWGGVQVAEGSFDIEQSLARGWLSAIGAAIECRSCVIVIASMSANRYSAATGHAGWHVRR